MSILTELTVPFRLGCWLSSLQSALLSCLRELNVLFSHFTGLASAAAEKEVSHLPNSQQLGSPRF